MPSTLPGCAGGQDNARGGRGGGRLRSYIKRKNFFRLPSLHFPRFRKKNSNPHLDGGLHDAFEIGARRDSCINAEFVVSGRTALHLPVFQPVGEVEVQWLRWWRVQDGAGKRNAPTDYDKLGAVEPEFALFIRPEFE